LFAVIAYRLQADRFGDLDHATLQVLDGTAAKEAGRLRATFRVRFMCQTCDMEKIGLVGNASTTSRNSLEIQRNRME